MTKLVVALPADGQNASAETLNVEELGDSRFRVLNVPVWAYGIAFEDVVEGRLGDDGRVEFVRVVEKSGLLTIRAAGPDADPSRFSEVVTVLSKPALATERYSPSYCAFAVKPKDFERIEGTVKRLEDADSNIFVEIANEGDL